MYCGCYSNTGGVTSRLHPRRLKLIYEGQASSCSPPLSYGMFVWASGQPPHGELRREKNLLSVSFLQNYDVCHRNVSESFFFYSLHPRMFVISKLVNKNKKSVSLPFCLAASPSRLPCPHHHSSRLSPPLGKTDHIPHVPLAPSRAYSLYT
jgi:hypothetical protein